MHIQRIEKNVRFWNNTLQILRDFYLFIHLPLILGLNNGSDSEYIKWTTLKEVRFFEKGLVKRHSTLDSMFNVLHFSNYESLSPNKWLTNFAVTIALNVVNTEKIYHIVDEPLATQILCSTDSLFHRVQ